MRSSLLLVPLLLLPACTSHDDARTATESAPAPAPAAAATPAAPAPAPPAAAPSASSAPRWSAQEGWIEEPPTSAMRRAQFRLPDPDGAAEATLVVYHFGPGGGGGVEANVARWASQFEQPDGSDPAAAARTTTRTLKGVALTDVDLAGTYVAETSPGSGQRVREAGWRLLATILEPEGGPYYVKLVGPAATVAAHEARYRAFLAAALP
ncbi:MAG TPA: hypothetical protein VF530_05085 [Planctomycetota bacterium]